MEFGNKILTLRKKNNLSQEELAEKLGVARQTISKWELGETSPDLRQAKDLSKIFHVSLDELVGNDIQDILSEKVSNTEKLAGIIIKILKGIGIIFILMSVIDVIAFCLFTFGRKDVTSSNTDSETISCSLENRDYLISLGSDGYFNCSNCNKSMQEYFQDVIDWSNIDYSIKNIETYFVNHGGSCKL